MGVNQAVFKPYAITLDGPHKRGDEPMNRPVEHLIPTDVGMNLFEQYTKTIPTSVGMNRSFVPRIMVTITYPTNVGIDQILLNEDAVSLQMWG